MAAKTAPKTKRKSPAPVSLEAFIATLRKRVGPEGVKQADQLAKAVHPDVLNLAFRSCSKRIVKLNTYEERFYADLKKQQGQKAANAWRNNCLASKTADKNKNRTAEKKG